MISEAVQLEIVRSIPSITAMISGVVAAYFAYRAHSVARETKVVAEETKAAAEHTAENTNHMKDELVEAVRSASFAAGQKDQRENPS